MRKNKVQKNSTAVQINGVTYPTVAIACRKLDLKVNSVYVKAKRQGISIQESIESFLKFPIIHGEKEYNSYREMCDDLEISIHTFNRVFKKIYNEEVDPLEIALSIKSGKIFRKSRVFNVDGVEYKNIEELAKAFNINLNTLKKRLYRDKMELKEALNTPVNKLKKTS